MVVVNCQKKYHFSHHEISHNRFLMRFFFLHDKYSILVCSEFTKSFEAIITFYRKLNYNNNTRSKYLLHYSQDHMTWNVWILVNQCLICLRLTVN